MLALVAAALLSATPATGLTLSAQLGRATTSVDKVMDAIEKELVAATLPLRRVTLGCEGERACVLKGARDAGLPAIVSVSIAWSKRQATVDLEALRVTDGAVLAQLTFSFSGRFAEADRAALRSLGARVVDTLAPAPKDEPVVEAPPTLVPAPVVAPPPVLIATPAPAPAPRRSRVPAWLLGGGAVASGVTAGVFLGLAAEKNGRLGLDPNPLTRDAAGALAAEANAQYSVALATGLAAGALATGAILWLVTE